MKKVNNSAQEEKQSVNKENKTKALIVAASICLLAGAVGVGFAQADNKDNRQQSLIKSFAQRFNLSEKEVEEAFVQHREQLQTEKRAEMKTRHEERLDKAIAEGKLTSDQKQLVLQKIDEMQRKKGELKKQGREFREERREQMQQLRDELKQWAADNGIEEDVIGIGMGVKDGQGRGRGRGMGMGAHRNW